jgi:Tol biopolymer transport system component
MQTSSSHLKYCFFEKTRIPFLILLLSAVIGIIGCSDDDKPTKSDGEKLDPHVKEVVRGSTVDPLLPGTASVDFPNWSPDGSRIYYMNIGGNWQDEYTYPRKEIRVVDTSGTNSELLFEGPYLFLTLSPDGSKFATNIERLIYGGFWGGHPVLIDIASGQIDPLPVDTSLQCSMAAFTPSGDSLIFYATYQDTINGNTRTNYYWGSFYAFDIKTRQVHKLFPENPFYVAGLDITPDGRRIISAGQSRLMDGTGAIGFINVGIWQSLSPSGDSVIGAFGLTPWRGTYVALTELATDTRLKKMYPITPVDQFVFFEFQYSPDGKRVAFCASVRLSEGSGFDFGLSRIFILTLY